MKHRICINFIGVLALALGSGVVSLGEQNDYIYPKRKVTLVITVALLSLVGLTNWIWLVRASPSQNCNVPGNYDTIQAAINDPTCLEVLVGSGTFYETVTITRTVKIQGQGPNVTTIDGIAGGSVISIDGSSSSTISVNLEGLNITNGAANMGGGIYNNEATLNLTHSSVSGNWASSWGGGIYSNLGELNVINSNINNNEANFGGGIYIDGGAATFDQSTIGYNEAGFHAGGLYNAEGSVTLDEVSVTGNKTYVDGGGIFNRGTMTINNSSINHNESTNYSGGGIRNEGTAYVNNTTISSNSAVIGAAGIDNEYGVLRLSSSTVANNLFSGGIRSYESNVHIQNSIVLGNSPDDCGGTIRSDGYNIIKVTSNCDYHTGSGDMVGTVANLGPLAGDPGYHPLLLGPGINRGNPDGCTNHQGQLLTTDQRGMPRVGQCDVGAYEYQGEYYQVFLPVCFNEFCPDFFDDFTNPGSGWEAGEDEFVRSEYLDGEYRVLSKNDQYFYVYSAPTCARENYAVEVDARWVGAPGASYGIVFGIAGDYEQYYLFDVNTDYQDFGLWRYDGNDFHTIVPITGSWAINSGTATNRLKVIREGQQITLEVNGLYLGTWMDGNITGMTGAGILSSPYEGEPVSDARFDNFSVSRLNGSTAAMENTVVDPAPAQHVFKPGSHRK